MLFDSSQLTLKQAKAEKISANNYTVLPQWVKQFPELKTINALEYLSQNSQSFRFAARLLPTPRLKEIAGIYSYCRFTDDLVDRQSHLPVTVLKNILEDWKTLSYQAHSGKPTGIMLIDQVLIDMGRKNIPFFYVEELLAGMQMDLVKKSYRDMGELKLYTFRVAGVIGQWLTEWCGINDPVVLQRAADLGHAMQITNILRDVGEDWRQGRLYLPEQLLAKHKLDAHAIEALTLNSKLIPHKYHELLEELMSQAEYHYQLAFSAIPELPAFFRKPALLAGYIYRGIHGALRRNNYDNLNCRAITSRSRKLALAFLAYVHLQSLKTKA